MKQRKLYFVAGLALLLVLGFLATSLTSFFIARDSVSRGISEQMLPLTSDNIYSEIQRDLLRPILISSLMASDTFVRDWTLDGENDPERIRTYLAEIQQRYDTITAFFVSERTFNYYHPDGVLEQVDPEDPADEWYFRVRAQREPYEVNVDTDTADRSRLSIFINYRVYDYAGQLLGVTGVGLSVEAVARLIEDYEQRYGREIYFVDRQGNVTLTGRGRTEQQVARIQERPGLEQLSLQILSNPSTTLTYSQNGDKVYLNSRIVPEFDWFLVVEQPSSQAEQRIEAAFWVNILLSSAILALVLVIAWYALRNYQRRLEVMATTDRLTGTANRHMFEMFYEHVARTAMRRPRPVSLVCMDIDRFKEVNDQFGHQGGDRVLQAVADIIREQVRDSDVLCRWGGEEFLLLLDDCSLEDARQRAEQIRMTIRAQAIPFGREEIRVTLSAGVAEKRINEELSLLVSRADKALYEAKSLGRDRVTLSPS